MADVTEVVQETQEQMEVRLRVEFEQKYEVWKAKDLAQVEEDSDTKIRGLVADYFQKLEEEKKPLTQEQIQTLLSQEYAEFELNVKANGKVRKFTIRELSQEAEQKFYKQFREQVIGRASDIAALAQQNMDQPFEKKVESFFNTFDGAFDILADAAALVLNPDNTKAEGDDELIDRKWCQKNLNSYRMWNIVQAQIEVNKLRDFFSKVFESGAKTQTMTTSLNVQNLQQLLRK